MVSALASSFVSGAAVLTADIITEASVLATLRPPSGLNLGVFFVTEAATHLAKLTLVLGLDWQVMAPDSPFSLPAMICLMRLPEADQPSASSGVMSYPCTSMHVRPPKLLMLRADAVSSPYDVATSISDLILFVPVAGLGLAAVPVTTGERARSRTT
ncbi:hypothetical protein MTO96_025235 [Rhipicephalus appendiculatus]